MGQALTSGVNLLRIWSESGKWGTLVIAGGGAKSSPPRSRVPLVCSKGKEVGPEEEKQPVAHGRWHTL